jgi:hypothetical protein
VDHIEVAEAGEVVEVEEEEEERIKVIEVGDSEVRKGRDRFTR